MKINLIYSFKLFLFFLVTVAFLPTARGQITAMSFNIRYDNPADESNAWPQRKQELVHFLDSIGPDIIGVQESLHQQVVFLDSSLSDYSYVGVGRDDGKTKGEYAPIFYRKSWLKLISYNTHWLSETDDTGSVGWDAVLPRIIGVAKFEDLQTGKIILVLNTHFDHQGKDALEGATLFTIGVIQEYRQKSPYADALILMGDFNAEPQTVQMQFLAGQFDDTFQKSQNGAWGPIGTYNGFDTNKVAESRIDYIYTNDFHIRDYQCIAKLLSNGRPISDHWPVLVKLDYE